jgi:hypothetical protein
MAIPLPKKAEAFSFEEAARKDSAVHVSLSSDSLVKHPGTSRSRLTPTLPHCGAGQMGKSRRTPHIRHGQRSWPDVGHRVNSEGFADAPSRRSGGAPSGAYIGFTRRCCQRPLRQKSSLWIAKNWRLPPRRHSNQKARSRRTAATILRRSCIFVSGVSPCG